ncbi:chemical-damaging agent resistance protein C [Humibacillus sp. DSM 29435]|uniref:TerD family protein n=1 Tax=Humibacillus sp. DSM 29435 TaxID=1869167 RepID=UPI0008726CE6|nr:TerD family protein [Humibacillus sp. DSM 29435]OFE16154.1 chemical-damaging agent resistance protein C [Humibacillus sp. DSM 29435]
MSISLSKGGNISLSKASPGLIRLQVGLGWDARTTTGFDFDLDASVVVCDANGRCINDRWFVFYGQLVSPNNAVVHQGDNLDGSGDGDDEVVKVELTALPPEAQRLVFVVSIHDAEVRGQNFGQVQNSSIRMVDETTGGELVRYDLTEDYSTETAMIFGELYRHGTEWKFRAIGQGYAGGLASVIKDFGLIAG